MVNKVNQIQGFLLVHALNGNTNMICIFMENSLEDDSL